MNASWDTPEYWARSEADEIVRDMPEREPIYLADSLEASAASCDADAEMVALIVDDLRRRAVAGVRFWPAPEPRTLGNGVFGARYPMHLEDDEIPW